MIKLLKSLSNYYVKYKVYVDVGEPYYGEPYYGNFISIGKIGKSILDSNLEDTPFEKIVIKTGDKMENGALTIKSVEKDENGLRLDKREMRVYIHVDGHDYELMDCFKANQIMKKRFNGLYASGPLLPKDPIRIGEESMMPHDIINAIQKEVKEFKIEQKNRSLKEIIYKTKKDVIDGENKIIKLKKGIMISIRDRGDKDEFVVQLKEEGMSPSDVIINKNESLTIVRDKLEPVIGQLGVYSHQQLGMYSHPGWKSITDKEAQEIFKIRGYI